VNVTQPSDFVTGPDRYPEPDYEAIDTVSRVRVPDDETVGWVVLQGEDRLAWLSASGAEDLGFPIRLHVDGVLRQYAAQQRLARDAWAEILRLTLHTTPREEFLPAVPADIRAAWGGATA
jgi:hypothetical protein